MPTDRFPSPFDIATPEGAEGWESMYDWYHLFGPERRELDEQRFWFADRLHHPDVLHPYDEIQCECWWQALGAVLATLTGGTLDRPTPRDRRT
jgi:pyruvate,water dikinase